MLDYKDWKVKHSKNLMFQKIMLTLELMRVPSNDFDDMMSDLDLRDANYLEFQMENNRRWGLE